LIFVSTGGGGGGGVGAVTGGTGAFDISEVLDEVGPVFRGSATVACWLSIIVAFGSGSSRLVGLSIPAFRSIVVARIVAFGSSVCGAINKPPSNVQNF
jgi:hypothetical protein